MAKTLVLYYSATNTTKKIAEQVAQKLNADMAEIHPEQPYTAADLNWHDESSRTTVEQHEHNSRVDIKDDLPDITNYDHLDLNGKNLALFATSGGTNYDRSQSYVERTVNENGYDTKVNQGAILNNPRQIDGWIDSLNFK